jgi:energy-coupling factor transport system ATP-binding protein
MFDLRGVWHTYSGPPAVEALRGVDLTIQPGEYVAVIGANGSGKSTLARHLNALLLPTRGQVRAAGLPSADPTAHGPIRRAVQMVFQRPDAQIVAANVEEDVAFGPENFGIARPEMQARVQHALETVGLWELRARPPHRLSSGQKQRLAIAGALAVRPQALVLDEATAMLDPAARRAVLALLAGLHAAGTTLVTITHEMDEAALAERIIVLDRGRVALDGPPRQVFAQPAELRRLGLDLPPMAALAQRLGQLIQRPLPVCLSLDDLLAALGAPPLSELPTPLPELRALNCAPPPANSEHSGVWIRDLRYAYLRGGPLETEALKGVDLDAPAGSALGLIGPTGSGKSTLLQHLNGLLRPQSGQVIVAGVDWSNPRLEAAAAQAARLQVGLLFQQPEDQLFERFLGDDVAFGPRQMKLDPAEVRRRVQTAMEAVGLPFEAFKDRLSRSLSGGEQRRAALAGVLALQPRLLAADEPTAGLDPRGRADIVKILRRIHTEGVTLVFASHRLEDIAALCDHVAALQDGRVLVSGETRPILASPPDGLPIHPLVPAANALRRLGWPVPEGALTRDELTTHIMKF